MVGETEGGTGLLRKGPADDPGWGGEPGGWRSDTGC